MTSDSAALLAENTPQAEAPSRRGRKPGKSSATAGSTKYDRERFVELLESRMDKALKAIEVIGNLSNRAIYPSTPKDVAQIFGNLREAVDTCEALFTKPETRKKRRFKLTSD